MRTLGFILGTLVLFLGTSVMAGTEYGPAQHGMDSISVSSIYAGDAFQDQVSIDSSGNLFITYASKGLNRTKTLYTSNWGTAWTTVDSSLVHTNTQPMTELSLYQYSFGNQTFLLGNQAQTFPPQTRLRLFSGTTKGIMDTVNTGVNYGDYIALGRHGGSDSDVIVYSPVEGAIDTVRVYQSNGNPTQTTTWTRREDSSVAKYGAGGRWPFVWGGGVKGGIAILNAALEDLFWADTTGVDTLSTAFVPNNLPNTSEAPGMIDIVPVVDSFGFVVWQTSITASACSLLVRAFHISNVGGGSGTYVVDSTSPSKPITTLVAPGKLKTNMVFCPRGAVLWGTDTAFIWSWYYPDTTNTKQAQIVRWLSADKGRTWGSMTVDRDSTGYARAATAMGLTTPKRVYNSGGTINFACVYQDSTVVNSLDTARVWISSLSVGATPSKSYRRKRLLGL